MDAVVTLGIDDMRDPAKYEAYLRPILDRLKKLDGRAPVSIMSNRVEPTDERLQAWLREGLSLECHTFDHPCPILKDKDFAKAKLTYDKCVDLLASVPSSKPVAFRVPCCDSLNTPSPRFYAHIFNGVTAKKNFLAIDSSVFCVLTPKDTTLPREWTLDASGGERFRKYIPPNIEFVNTIDDYPYPYVLGRLGWEFPCVVPSDWEAQRLHKPNNPSTVEDWKIALDAVLRKQGTFNLVFHPHNWIKPEQVVELIDHAAGKKIKFLTFRECLERLEKNALGGASLRAPDGGDAGVRLLDVDGDGYMDVVNAPARKTRLWMHDRWFITGFPLDSLEGARFGIVGTSVVLMHDSGAWRFTGPGWTESRLLTLKGIQRLRDVDGDGTCEAIAGRAVHRWTTSGWEKTAELPWDVDSPALRFVDLNGDGKDDLVASDESGALVAVYEGPGWRTIKTSGVPLLSRAGMDNGAWFHSKHLWIQNEDTASMKNLVDKRSFEELLKP
ncbi:MAG TPA: polysaccharide deacetylase family protein [Planctomycetota bacterium]